MSNRLRRWAGAGGTVRLPAERLLIAGLCSWVGFMVGLGLTRDESRATPALVADPAAAAPGVEPDAGACGGGYVGVLVGSNTARLASKYAGRLVDLPVAVGERVRRGQVLASFDSASLDLDEAQARAAIQEAQAAADRAAQTLASAREEHRRTEALGRFVSAEQRQQSRHAEGVAQASLAAARATLEARIHAARRAEHEAGENLLRAPFDGVVSQRFVNVGVFVNAAAPVLEIVSNDQRLLRFAVPGGERPRLSVGQRLSVQFEGTPRAWKGVVSNIAPEVDPLSNTVTGEAHLDQLPDQLANGLMGHVSLDCSPEEERFAGPLR